MNTSNHTTARQFTALGLAAFVTLAMLASVNLLATQPNADVQMAKHSNPTQVVVIEARRSPRG